MRIFGSFEEASIIRNPVVTTGSFDGVHVGHKTILDRLKMLAARHNGESVLVTFDPHPRKVLHQATAGRELKLINSQEEKLIMLERSGLDNVIIVNFTIEFSRITSEQFVKDLLAGILHARVIVVGFNHHFGFNQEGDYKQLWKWREKYNFEAEEIPEQEVYNETVSSTRIRQAISEGYIQRANAYLDHYYIIRGPLERCIAEDAGSELMYRVIIQEESKLLPPPGIYAASAETVTGSAKAMVMINKTDVRPEVVVEFFDLPAFLTEAGRVTLFFHKKIHGAVNPGDDRAHARISHARREISDLIY
jgi:riboflavin kinase / FMN adenylyltransferase